MLHANPIRALLSSLLLVAAPAGAAGPDETPATPAARLLDARGATSLGLTAGWQSKLPLLAGTAVQGIRLVPSPDGKPEGECLYAWDRAGVVMKLDPQSGEVRWTSASVADRTGSGLLDVFSATVKNRVVVVGLGDANCLALDGRTGSEEGLTPYARIPVTSVVRSGNEFIYGSRAGQVVWIAMREEAMPRRKDRQVPLTRDAAPEISAIHVVPYETHAHSLHGSIVVPPVSADGKIVACSSQGQVLCFLSDSKRIAWQMKLPGGIVATPAATDTQVFIACRDQYLRCVQLAPAGRGSSEEAAQKRLAAGSVAWKWFTETPLERPPFVSGNRVVIQVDGLGLVALDADPGNTSLDRRPLWISKAAGDAITRFADGILVWDRASSTLSLVDADSGAVRNSITLPDAVIVSSTSPTNGDLLVVASDGRVQRCGAMHPIAKPAASPAEQPKRNDEPAADAAANPGASTAGSSGS